ncbi:MAG: MBL fold metallo-hydrolase [Bacteroidales bacterium]|nr:MBL fold metallo-hydrolase [Bacteroidales bacterium]
MEEFENKPFTIKQLSKSVYNIEDSFSAKPSGKYFEPNGKLCVNNCSDIYFVIGTQKVAIVDLSNPNSFPEASMILYRLAKLLSGGREICIVVTHNHFDHLGLISHFLKHEEIEAYLPENDFNNYQIFPPKRTHLLKNGDEINLGNISLKAFQISGHTLGSMIYVVENENIIISGDAFGSGKNLWLFYPESINHFISTTKDFLNKIDNKEINIDTENLNIYPGHRWMGGYNKIGFEYIKNLYDLANDIINHKVEPKTYRSPVKYINTEYCGNNVCIDCGLI